MSSLSARGELLRHLATILVAEPVSAPFAVALCDHQPRGPFDLAVRPLPSSEPISALFEFRAPAQWVAFGVAVPATARADHGECSSVRAAFLVDRDGVEVHLVRDELLGTVLVDRCESGVGSGRIVDACRRVLGLCTAPPHHDPRTLWSLDWLDRVLACVLARDLDHAPPDWPELRALYRGRPPDASRWPVLRRACAAGELDLPGITAAQAAWMDDGMFSREALAGFPDAHDLLGDLRQLLPPATVRRVVAELRLVGAPHPPTRRL